MPSTRSTSPPKSAWPGVSTMLMRTPFHVTAVHFDEDRDAALALEIVRVHRALGDDLAGAERAGLLEQAVDERGLAVIDVRDDGDVADAWSGHGYFLAACSCANSRWHAASARTSGISSGAVMSTASTTIVGAGHDRIADLDLGARATARRGAAISPLALAIAPSRGHAQDRARPAGRTPRRRRPGLSSRSARSPRRPAQRRAVGAGRRRSTGVLPTWATSGSVADRAARRRRPSARHGWPATMRATRDAARSRASITRRRRPRRVRLGLALAAARSAPARIKDSEQTRDTGGGFITGCAGSATRATLLVDRGFRHEITRIRVRWPAVIRPPAQHARPAGPNCRIAFGLVVACVVGQPARRAGGRHALAMRQQAAAAADKKRRAAAADADARAEVDRHAARAARARRAIAGASARGQPAFRARAQGRGARRLGRRSSPRARRRSRPIRATSRRRGCSRSGSPSSASSIEVLAPLQRRRRRRLRQVGRRRRSSCPRSRGFLATPVGEAWRAARRAGSRALRRGARALGDRHRRRRSLRVRASDGRRAGTG